MQIEINTGKCELLLVKIPDNVNPSHILKDRLTFDEYDTNSGIYMPDYVMLPQGNWTLIGNAFKLTEEQCKGVVSPLWDYYKNYTTIDDGTVGNYKRFVTSTAIQSFASLLLANNIHKTNPLQQEWDEACTWGHGGCTMEEYKKAGERVGNWVVLKKEGKC